jgi:hypothetical protein
MRGMHPLLALELSTTVLVIVAVISVVLLVLIIVAPWKDVRKEPPLDKSVEAKLLLHRNPDEPTGEVPRVSSVPIDDSDDEFGGDLSELADLAGPEPSDPQDPPAAR